MRDTATRIKAEKSKSRHHPWRQITDDTMYVIGTTTCTIQENRVDNYCTVLYFIIICMYYHLLFSYVSILYIITIICIMYSFLYYLFDLFVLVYLVFVLLLSYYFTYHIVLATNTIISNVVDVLLLVSCQTSFHSNKIIRRIDVGFLMNTIWSILITSKVMTGISSRNNPRY